MKRLFLLFATCAISASVMAQEQSKQEAADSVATTPRYQPQNLYASSEKLEDVVATGVATGLVLNPNHRNSKYRLYGTENIWTFLKLDTCTGRIWQVQYAINDDNRMQTQIVSVRLDWTEDWSDLTNMGRFELYPTKNMYNFLLIDKQSGRIWQIQWSTNPDNRGVIAEIQ